MYSRNWKKIFFLYFYSVAFLSLLFAFPINSQASTICFSGNPVVQHFVPNDYNAHAQNFAIDQDSNGVYYIANVNGVLEYDGTYWNLISHPENAACVSLKYGFDHNIYVGFEGDFGYLHPDSTGSMVFNSLKPFVPDSLRNFSFVWRIFDDDRYIWFSTKTGIFRWNPEVNNSTGMKIWSFRTSVSPWPLFQLDNKIILQHPDSGFQEIVGDSLVPFSGLEKLADNSLWSLFQVNQDSIFVIGGDTALEIFTDKKIISYKSEISDFANEYVGNYCSALPNGMYVMASNLNGVALFDNRGNIFSTINRSSAGIDNTVLGQPFVDRNGFIWLPLKFGIARINPSLNEFDYTLGIDGGVFSLCKYQGRLYAGTTQGLFVSRCSTPRWKAAKFESLKGVNVDCWGLIDHYGKLLGVDNQGLFQVSGDSRAVTRIKKSKDSVSLAADAESPYVFVGQYKGGLDLYRWENGNLELIRNIDNTLPRIRNIVIKNNREIWISGEETYKKSRIQRIKFTFDMSESEVTNYDSTSGLDEYGFTYPFIYNDNIFISTPDGIFKHNQIKDIFVPDDLLNPPGFEKPFEIRSPYVDSENRIWFTIEPYVQLTATPNDTGGFDYSALLAETDSRFINTYLYDTDQSTIWAGNREGELFCFSEKTNFSYDNKPQIHIRKVLLQSDSVLFGGHSHENLPTPAIEYSRHDLRFEYALTSASRNKRVKYQFRLIGRDDKWSNWSDESYHDFNGLLEGNYRFEVRGKDVKNNSSEAAFYEFKVLPPVYRSRLAYILYIISALILIYIFDKSRERSLQRQKAALEATVDERTQQLKEAEEKIRKHNEELEKLLEQRSRELVKSERQAAFGQMVQGIVHNLRSPLTVNIGATEMIAFVMENMAEENQNNETKCEKLKVHQGKIDELLDNINNSNLLMNNMLKSLMRKSKSDMSDDIEKINLCQLLKDEWEFLKANKSFAELTFKELLIPDEKLFIEVIPGDLAQVFQNLVNNSLDAMENLDSRELYVSVIQENNNAVFTVSDSGPGIPAEIHDKIFDPFFTTKKKPGSDDKKTGTIEGTGLGLWMSRETIHSFNGSISIESSSNKGATFKISIPISNGN